jgi:hypothetical protein
MQVKVGEEEGSEATGVLGLDMTLKKLQLAFEKGKANKRNPCGEGEKEAGKRGALLTTEEILEEVFHWKVGTNASGGGQGEQHQQKRKKTTKSKVKDNRCKEEVNLVVKKILMSKKKPKGLKKGDKKKPVEQSKEKVWDGMKQVASEVPVARKVKKRDGQKKPGGKGEKGAEEEAEQIMGGILDKVMMKVISGETGVISKEKKVSEANPVIKIDRPVILLYFIHW